MPTVPTRLFKETVFSLLLWNAPFFIYNRVSRFLCLLLLILSLASTVLFA